MAVNLPPLAAVGLTRPLLSPLWSAGFSFSKCHAQLKVGLLLVLCRRTPAPLMSTLIKYTTINY